MSITNETLELCITDEGYVQIAETFMSNVLHNTKTSEDWSKEDAVVLACNAMLIGRGISDEHFIELMRLIGERNLGKPVVISKGVANVLG